MRLNVPPTLKEQSLMDSHSLTANSPINLASKTFKKSSKLFKEDGHSECGEDNVINEMMSIQSRKESHRLLSPQSSYGLQKKRSLDYDDDCKISEASFLKKMPLFNQYEEESNLSEIKLSQIPRRELDYQEDFNQEQLPGPLSSRMKRKSSSGDLQGSVDRSPELLKKGLKRLNSIDVINEESSSSQGNSLNGSRKMQQKASLLSSLRKTNPGKGGQSPQALQPIQEYNRQKHGIAQSSSSHSITNESSKFLQKQIEQLRNKNGIQVSEVQSQEQISHSNSSSRSCFTVNLKKDIEPENHTNNNKNSVPSSGKNKNNSKDAKNNKNTNKIQQKLMQIEKSLRLNDDYSMWDGTEADKSMQSFRNEGDRFTAKKEEEYQKQLNDVEKRLLTNMNDRFLKMKEISSGNNSNNNPNSNSNNPTITQPHFQHQYTQTPPLPPPQSHHLHKQHTAQLQNLQQQLTRLKKELQSSSQQVARLSIMKNKFQEESKFGMEKIRRLERILEKNQKELAEWKQLAKEGVGGRTDSVKESRKGQTNDQVHSQTSQIDWQQKQQQYIAKITQLQRQLQKVNQLLSKASSSSPLQNTNHHSTPSQQPFRSSSKIDSKKYKQHLQKLHRYEQNLTKNMQIIKRQQEKIIQQWRVIDQFHSMMNGARQYTQNTGNSMTSQIQYHYQNHQQTLPPEGQPTYQVYSNSLRGPLEDQNNFVYNRDTDVASISAKVKNMRSQLAREGK